MEHSIEQHRVLAARLRRVERLAHLLAGEDAPHLMLRKLFKLSITLTINHGFHGGSSGAGSGGEPTNSDDGATAKYGPTSDPAQKLDDAIGDAIDIIENQPHGADDNGPQGAAGSSSAGGDEPENPCLSLYKSYQAAVSSSDPISADRWLDAYRVCLSSHSHRTILRPLRG